MGRKSKAATEKGKKVSECIENEEGQKEDIENQEEEDEPMIPSSSEEEVVENQEDETVLPSSEEIENQEEDEQMIPSSDEIVENQEDEPVLPSSSEEIENEPTDEEKEREEEEEEEVVSDEGNDEEEGGEAADVWDMVRVIPTAEEQIQCRNEGCTDQAVATWASNNDPNDMWDICEKCQLKECGGWPEGVSPIEYSTTTSSNDVSLDADADADAAADDEGDVDTAPTGITTTADNNTIKDDDSSATAVAITSVDETVDLPKNDTASEESKDGNDTPPQDVTTTDEVEDEYKDEDEDDDDESFDLRQIISLQRLLSGPPLCSGGDNGECSLPSCSVWTSNKNPKDKWYYCIDCQKQDFGGWPPAKEMPCDRLEPEHLKVIAEKCSKKKNPVMPVLTRCITPLPNSPKPPKGVASQVVARGGKTGTAASSKNGGKPKKLSKEALGVRAKWLEVAKKNGGTRLILEHTEAKKAIFDTLFDAFQPMNFNDIYKTLKGEIPSAHLTNMLKEMSIGAVEEEPSFDSDDEGDDVNGGDNNEKEQVADKKKSKAPLGSLIFKQGRNIGSCLYYVDYTQKPDMTADERQSLFAKTAATDNEHEMLTTTLKFKTVQTKQLLSEPTNDQLTTLLSGLEKETSNLVEDVAQAQALTVNEAHKTKLKRKIQKIGAAYAKRKRLCTSALSALEEISEGTLSSKKILAGDGQICVDSDESVNKAAIAYAKDKRGNKGRSSMGGIGRKKSKDTQPSLADENFVGVSLDAQGSVKRVFAV